jgi:ATP-dependent helicase/nuclease subunit A
VPQGFLEYGLSFFDQDLAYEHNGSRIPRDAFYAIACNPRRSVAVEACAGAGKTWMLVSRIVRALLDGCPPQDILAITFTKKAAGEMRERLHEWLTGFATETPEKLVQQLLIRGVLPADIGATDAAQLQSPLLTQLAQLQQTVLAAGRPVQIRTFHSWFAALLRTAPLSVMHRLGLPVDYELLEDDSEAVARTWRPFYTAVLRDDGLHADFTAAVASHGRTQTLKALTAALSRRVEFVLADAQGAVERALPRWDAMWPDMADSSAGAGAGAGDGNEGATPDTWLLAQSPALYAASRALGKAGAKTFAAKGGELERAVTAGDVAGVLAALLTQKLEPRKFGDKLEGIEAIRAAQDLAMRHGQAAKQHAAWLHHHRMARLTRLLLAVFADVKRERGWVDMNDVERAAQLMLSDDVLSGWVQQRLDARVRHLLIDEFQDTNPLQWQALQAWLSGYAGAGGGGPSVFLVGDPKQSIYRFRRAEPQVFLAAQAFVVEGLGGDRLACDHTRRNAPEVITLVNTAMAAAQAAGEVDGFRTHTTESHDTGEVLCLPQIQREDGNADEDGSGGEDGGWRDSLTVPRVLAEDSQRHRECRQVAVWLERELARTGTPPKEVMVLARRRAVLSVMQDALRDAGIAAQQPEKVDLGDAPEVQDIIALLDALVSPGHDLSLARALKSPLFSLPDADLVEIALARKRLRAAEAPDSSWFAVLQQPAALPEHLRAIGPTLLRWKALLDRLPPHDAIDTIYQQGDVLARFAAAAPAPLRATTLARLRAVPGAALQIDGGRYATPYGFVRALKAGGIRAPMRADTEAVRLLTVHGAKGLEADWVLLLDTDAAAPRAETMGVLVDWPGEAPAPVSFLFLASETDPPPSAVRAVETERHARQREELNGLYVAVTRARRRLVLSSSEPHRSQDGSWWRRLQPLCAPAAVGAAGQDIAAGAVGVDGVDGGVVLPLAEDSFTMPWLPHPPATPDMEASEDVWTDSPEAGLGPSPAADAEAGARATDAAIGLAMHRLLEWAPVWVDAPPAAAHTPAQLRAVAREFALGDKHSERAADLAARILAGEGAWAWDSRAVDWHANEVALVHAGQMHRLDRLVRRRDTGEWWVLDYKSAHAPQDHIALQAQLRGYRAAVQAAHPQARVRTAFLTGQGTLVLFEDNA